jgi:N-acetylglucosamine-6-phosphate deacetylase
MDGGANVTRQLTNHGIRVAAGHSDATLDQLKQSLDAGLSLFTHLGNGCPASLHRHDNIVQRVLSLAERLCISFIADGHHVPFFALKNYLQCVPAENILIVSDCMSAAGLGPGTYPLGDQVVHVDDDRAAWSADRKHFAGSATSIVAMQKLMSENLALSPMQIHQYTHENPSKLLLH